MRARCISSVFRRIHYLQFPSMIRERKREKRKRGSVTSALDDLASCRGPIWSIRIAGRSWKMRQNGRPRTRALYDTFYRILSICTHQSSYKTCDVREGSANKKGRKKNRKDRLVAIACAVFVPFLKKGKDKILSFLYICRIHVATFRVEGRNCRNRVVPTGKDPP